MLNTRSIQFRLILWYSGLVIAVLLAFAYYTYEGLRKELYSNMEISLARRAEQIASYMLSQENVPAALAQEIHAAYMPEANNRFFRLLNTDHSILYVSGIPQDKRFDPTKIPIPAQIPLARIEKLDTDTNSDDVLIVSRAVDVNGKPYTFEIGVPTSEVEQGLQGLVITLQYSLPFIILIVSGGGYLLVNNALKPVEDIRFTAERITLGNLSRRLPVAKTGDALEHLSVTLNQMLDRLEIAYEQASRFSADASHELRTPLTILRGELEMLSREQTMKQPIRERISSILEETERLSRITDHLFTLSRLDAGEARMDYQPCNLSLLAHNTAEQMALLADEKHIALHIDTGQPAPVTGDAARLKQVVVNLLDNAIKYTPARGNIWLKTLTPQHKAVLEIRDDGIGIAASALPHIFDRFYRTDRARSREMGGAGLGLSIVRSIVQAHGGSVEAQSIEGKGTTFRVELPLAEG